MSEEPKTTNNTEVCVCGRVFNTFGPDDYNTGGSESGVCCPDCGNEDFQTVADLRTELAATKEKADEYEEGIYLIDKSRCKWVKKCQEAEAELDKYRWIPVSEKLPEVPDEPPNASSETVWLIYNGEAHYGYYTNFAGWWVYGQRFQKRLNQKDITHWMPIPTLPLKGGKDE
ncbi:hypothetical protein LCGC14_0800550 [marine sediment metagenome]|uniref:DUF551 domain-containing protein n=1 Tax=marine sediment metagenome TaxID=412755 RepID=A0A0F9S9P6_9ZZZZ